MYYLIKRTLPGMFDNYYCDDYADNYEDYSISNSKPSVNVIELNDQFKIEVAAPGISKKDLKINLEKEVLTISTKKEEVSDEDSSKWIRKEFNYKDFERSFTLPETVNSDLISAKHENGVFYITIPKKEQAVEKAPRTIEIS
ncbi:Hsp20/alpha crystallin family protein [Bacteroidota bacterium]